MDHFNVDWALIFQPDVPIMETVVRGSVIYLAMFIMARFGMRRLAGEVNVQDFVFALIVANAGATAMLGASASVSNSLVLIALITGLHYVMNFLGYHIPKFDRFLAPEPLQIVRDGKPIRRNLRREFLTDEELNTSIRAEGYEDISEGKEAYVEGDGSISVIPYETDEKS